MPHNLYGDKTNIFISDINSICLTTIGHIARWNWILCFYFVLFFLFFVAFLALSSILGCFQKNENWLAYGVDFFVGFIEMFTFVFVKVLFSRNSKYLECKQSRFFILESSYEQAKYVNTKFKCLSSKTTVNINIIEKLKQNKSEQVNKWTRSSCPGKTDDQSKKKNKLKRKKLHKIIQARIFPHTHTKKK